MSRTVPHFLPSEYSHDGLDQAVGDLLGCNATWVANHEVDLPTDTCALWGLVHEFHLAGHATADRCFVVRCRGSETYVYLKDSSVRDADAAVRRMLAERRPS